MSNNGGMNSNDGTATGGSVGGESTSATTGAEQPVPTAATGGSVGGESTSATTSAEQPAPTAKHQEATNAAGGSGDVPTKGSKEFYLNENPLSGTWIHAQARLHIALLGPKPEPEEDSKEMAEPEEECDEEEEPEEECDEEEESVGLYESNAGEIESDNEDDDEYSPKGRPILNLKEVLRTTQLVKDVINNEFHGDADTVLSLQPPKKKKGRKGNDWATVGHEDSNATPRQLAKRMYQFIMEYGPRNEDGDPDYQDVHCQSFSTDKDKKDKVDCKCIKNSHNKVHNDLCILSGGDVDDPIAKRIHKARWIGFFERLIKKMQMISQYPYEEESLFSFLHVAFPYPNPSQQNRASHIVYEDKETGIKLKGCFYLALYILGDYYNFTRGEQFQSKFWSGMKKKDVTLGNFYVADVVQSNGRNSMLLGCMLDFCVEEGKMLDFAPEKLPKEGNITLPKFIEYLALKRIDVGSYVIEKHLKYIARYYAQVRKLFVELREQGILLVAHPNLFTEASLPISKFQASTLLKLDGADTYDGVQHFADPATAEIQEMALLDSFFQGLVAQAGHSGRKNLALPPPKPWGELSENATDRARKDKKNANKRAKRAAKKQAANNQGAKKQGAKKQEDKKRKRPSHEEVPLLSPSKKKANTQRYFLTQSRHCSSIMERVGELTQDNCWKKGLESLQVTVTDDLETSCESAHNMCIEVCNAMLPAAKRGVEKYEVFSRLSLMMNFRDTNDEWHTIEAPHMDLEPTQLADLNSEGVFPFIAIVPLQKEGNFTRMHPKWENKKPETEEGRLIYSPFGSMVVMPATMVYGCGIRTGNGGNPCLKVHYFLKEKGVDGSQQQPAATMTEMPKRLLDALKFHVAVPEGLKPPEHPSRKMAAGDHTVYLMERKYLVYLIKKSKMEKAKGKKKGNEAEKETLVVEAHMPAGPFYGPKILEDLYEVVGL